MVRALADLNLADVGLINLRAHHQVRGVRDGDDGLIERFVGNGLPGIHVALHHHAIHGRVDEGVIVIVLRLGKLRASEIQLRLGGGHILRARWRHHQLVVLAAPIPAAPAPFSQSRSAWSRTDCEMMPPSAKSFCERW